MADSFYQTDLFIRGVPDSGVTPSGAISNPKVREPLRGIQARHARIGIPAWMQTYFGFSLLARLLLPRAVGAPRRAVPIEA